MLRARAIPREATSEKVNNLEKQNKMTFNTTYHPVLQDVREILQELHLTLASDDGHKKVFPDVPLIGFKINKNLKAHLVRSQLPELVEVCRSHRCEEKDLADEIWKTCAILKANVKMKYIKSTRSTIVTQK